MSLDDMNFYGDARVVAGLKGNWYLAYSEAKMQAQIQVWDENDEVELTVPITFGVCPTCGGKGKHVNPSIDSGGLSAEDFAEDPDFEEAYFAGHYDITCIECGGKRVIPEPAYDAMPSDLAKQVKSHLQSLSDDAYERSQELRYGY